VGREGRGGLREELEGTALVDPGSGEGLQVCLAGGLAIAVVVCEGVVVAVEVLEDIGDVHVGGIGCEEGRFAMKSAWVCYRESMSSLCTKRL